MDINKNISNNNSFEDEINIKELFIALWSKKYLIVSFTSIFAILGILYSLSLPNIYTSKSLLAPMAENDSLTSKLGNISSFAAVGGINLPSSQSDKTKEALARIKSFEFFSNHFLPNIKLENIIASKKWLSDKDKLIYDKNLFDIETRTWIQNDSNASYSSPTDQQAFKAYKEKISITIDPDTSYITISADHHSPKVAKDWVNLIIFQINESMRKIDAEDAERSIIFLNDSSNKTNVQSLREAYSTLLEEQIQILMLSASSKYYVLKVIDSPIVPELKSKPNRTLICIVITLVGGFMSIFIALFQHYRKSIDLL
jgi:uncharacterized protein involved in exopolysaccharide biosynthesis